LRYRRSWFSHFYFSCQKYQETAQTRIATVVRFFTTNPTKLSLHFSEFSTIFYAFYNVQQFTTTIEDSLCTGVPRNIQNITAMHLSLCKEGGSRNWVPGHGGSAAPPIPARPTALPAGRGCGEECMLTKGPLKPGTWAGRHSTTAHGSDRRGRPQCPRPFR
jgi:hypothetical protein